MPVIQKLKQTYKLWQESLPHIPKTTRYSLGLKIDKLFLETIEIALVAIYVSPNEKILFVRKASAKIDFLKFFLQILWEIKAMDNKKYIEFANQLNEIGKMFGGWSKQLQKRTSA